MRVEDGSARCHPGATPAHLVPAPLAPAYAPACLWWDDERSRVALARGARSPDTDADVVVVGAGYTGLSAARELARRGRTVVVLDCGQPGSGASGRNGGMVHPGARHDLPSLLAGRGGADLWAECVTAFEELAALVGEHDIDCDWARTGHLELARHPRAAGSLRIAAEAHRRLGEDVSYLEGDELTAEIGSDAFCAGLLVRRSAAVQPAALVRGLATLAVEAGARLCDGTTVHQLIRRPGNAGITVETSDAVIRAGAVVLATGAATGTLAPWVARRVLPIGSFVIATEEIERELAGSVLPGRRMCFDTRNFLNYWRLSPDGRRVVFGGRTSFASTTLERARDVLYAAMVRVHPQLAGVRVERAWAGDVDLTVERMPHVGRDRATGAWYALGYSGTGVALATYLGAALARWMCGEGPPAFAGSPLRRVPGPLRLRGVLSAVGLWYRANDAIGR